MKLIPIVRAASAACLLVCGAALATGSVAPEPIAVATREQVLFPFDDVSLPFSRGLVLTLTPGRKSALTDPGHPNGPVLTLGPAGAPDDRRIYFYGTILFLAGEYRLWYSGYDQDRNRQICYAVSKDGIKWERPKLGLVDYHGNKDNNLVAIDDGQPVKGMCALVVHDPDDPDPARRFKMIREIDPTQVMAAVSADGLHWKSTAGNQDVIKASNLEPSGFIKFNGLYYLNGHGGAIPHPIPARGDMRPQKRKMETFVSADFVNWTTSAHLSFRRDNIPPRAPKDFEFHKGEQVHLGAGLWDRGNVILGFYGQYHNETNDRRTAVVDLGLIVSNDALHFREPLPDFKIVPSFEEPDRAEPRLTQAQGFQNIGDRSFVYYGVWTEVNRDGPTGVGIATWPRDRFGYFSPNLNPSLGSDSPHCISAPLTPARDGARVFINASGLSDLSTLKVEILDAQFRPLAEYSGENSVALEKSGLRLAVTWKHGDTLRKLAGPIRVRINWGGRKPEAAKLHAVYLE